MSASITLFILTTRNIPKELKDHYNNGKDTDRAGDGQRRGGGGGSARLLNGGKHHASHLHSDLLIKLFQKIKASFDNFLRLFLFFRDYNIFLDFVFHRIILIISVDLKIYFL